MNWDLAWGLFLAGAGVAFGTLEYLGIRANRSGKQGTLSQALRRWLHIQPPGPLRWLLGGLFAVGLLVFGIHIVTPWL